MWYAVRSDGKILATDDASEGGTHEFDPTGRFVAGVRYLGRPGSRSLSYEVWIASLRSGRVVRRARIRDDSGSPSIEWQGGELRWDAGIKGWLTLYRPR